MRRHSSVLLGLDLMYPGWHQGRHGHYALLQLTKRHVNLAIIGKKDGGLRKNWR